MCGSCQLLLHTHIYEHLQITSFLKHNPQTLKIKINPKNKEALIEELQKLSEELLDIKENLIRDTYKKIQELELSLIEALKRLIK
ncbi:unnamed protein product [Blepharisma stoltei]|uniref:Uncharacterized protein n=1 Tax=Blepharisma stoltei TaxID=1481888 RepID=A0AAU9JQU8_9CILI|nr:unnamed protein product [Blepharisma stoltei]